MILIEAHPASPLERVYIPALTRAVLSTCRSTICVLNYVIILHNIQKELKDTRQSKINTQQELEKLTERLKVRDATLYMVTIIIVMVSVCMYVCVYVYMYHCMYEVHHSISVIPA